MTRITRQHGYILLPVVILLTLVATVAFMLNNESALDSGITASNQEMKQAEQIAQAGLAHATWGAQNSGCAGDMGMTTVPFGQAGTGSYTATVTTPGGGTTAYPNLAADQDAWFRSDDITKNNGGVSSLHLRMETGNLEYAVVRFDLSTLPAGAQINSATARFYIKATKGHPQGPVDIHRLNADWTETDATWDTMGDKFDSTLLHTIPAQPAAGDVWVTVNLTAQVQAWVNGGEANYGIMLIPTGEGTHAEYISREGAANQQPRLDVIVGTGPATPMTITATGTLTGNPSPANDITRTLTRTDVPAYQPPGTVTLQLGTDPGADTVLDDFYPRNYGGADFVQLNGNPSWLQRPLFRFDLVGIPARASVISARLELRMRSLNTPGTATVHRVTRSWVEGTKSGTGTADGATWATYDGSNNWTSVGGDFNAAAVAETAINSTDTWVTWEIAPLVEQWLAGEPNDGLLIQADAALREAEFSTQEDADATVHPKLTITYACECGSACLAPQGSGNILMVVSDEFNMTVGEKAKLALFESWGYTVDLISQWDVDWNFDAKAANNDVVYVSEAVTSTTFGMAPKLAATSLGVISEEGELNDELGIAAGSASPVDSAITIVDNSHYITAPFASGSLSIYAAAMEQLTVSGGEAPGLQTLADSGGAGSLVVLDSGAMGTGGTPLAGRRVMLPLGTDTSFNWDYLNGNGRLIVQRALQWGTGNIGEPPPKLLFVAASLSPTAQEQLRIDLIGSWGYAVTLIDDNDSQANFDAAIAANDVAYVSSLATETALGAKLKAANIGVVNEQGALVDEFGFGQQSVNYKSRNEIDVLSNTHYITEPFATGLLTIVSVDQSLHIMTANKGPGFVALAQVFNTGSLWDDSLGVIETGGELFGGGNAAGRRVLLPWGDASFDVTALNADGLTLMQRAIEWAEGAGAAPAYNVLLVVGNATTLSSKDVGYKALMESWGHTVTLIDDGDSQTNFDTAMDAADVIYVSGSSSGPNLLDKLTNTTKGMVNEVNGKIDNFGFSSSTSSTANFDTFSKTNPVHYITEPFSGNPVTVFTSSLTNPVPGGTLAPDLQNVAEVSGTLALGTLDTGATRYDSNPSQGRRVHLPFTAAETTDMTADGKTIMQRALEWAAGVEPAPALTYNVLMIVGNLTLSSKDTGYKALMESWGHTVSLIDDGDSQANYDTAMAAADVIYASGSASGSSILDKPTNTPKGMVNEVNGKIDNFGFSSSTSSTANFDTFSKTDAAHYITESFSGNSVTVFTSSLTNPVPGGTLAPDMQNVAEVSGTLALGTLDTGATRYDSNPSQGRRVHLPFTAAETTDMTADGKTILQRAIEWAAGAGNGGGGGGPGPGSCDGTYRDEFSLRQYDQNNGTLSWATNWQETGETTDPTGGDIRIDNDVSNYQLQVRDDGQTVMREADLSQAGSATLSFEYRRENLSGSGDYVAVEVSYNGGTNWTELERFTGTATDTAYTSTSYDLDAGSLSANTRIRFLTPGSGMGNNNMVWFDNIQIQCSP